MPVAGEYPYSHCDNPYTVIIPSTGTTMKINVAAIINMKKKFKTKGRDVEKLCTKCTFQISDYPPLDPPTCNIPIHLGTCGGYNDRIWTVSVYTDGDTCTVEVHCQTPESGPDENLNEFF